MRYLQVKRETTKRRPPEYGRMIRVLLWMAYLVVLGLAHLHLRMATRDMDIQAGRYQAQSEDLRQAKNTLATEVARLREGDRMLEYARDRLGLGALPADQIEVWKMPKEILEKSNRVCSEIALARAGQLGRTEREPLVARVLGAVLSPVQAQAPSPGR